MYLVGYARVSVAHDYYAHCEAELIYKRSITTLAEWNLHRAELEPFLLNAIVADLENRYTPEYGVHITRLSLY